MQLPAFLWAPFTWMWGSRIGPGASYPSARSPTHAQGTTQAQVTTPSPSAAIPVGLYIQRVGQDFKAFNATDRQLLHVLHLAQPLAGFGPEGDSFIQAPAYVGYAVSRAGGGAIVDAGSYRVSLIGPHRGTVSFWPPPTAVDAPSSPVVIRIDGASKVLPVGADLVYEAESAHAVHICLRGEGEVGHLVARIRRVPDPDRLFGPLASRFAKRVFDPITGVLLYGLCAAGGAAVGGAAMHVAHHVGPDPRIAALEDRIRARILEGARLMEEHTKLCELQRLDHQASKTKMALAAGQNGALRQLYDLVEKRNEALADAQKAYDQLIQTKQKVQSDLVFMHRQQQLAQLFCHDSVPMAGRDTWSVEPLKDTGRPTSWPHPLSAPLALAFFLRLYASEDGFAPDA
jgi:hypothetical protein